MSKSISIIIFCLVFLIICGAVMPVIQSDLTDEGVTTGYADSLEGIANEHPELSSWTDIADGILGAFTWSFDFNIWVNLFFLIIKIIMLVAFIGLVRGV